MPDTQLAELRDRDLENRKRKRERRARHDEVFKLRVDGTLVLETLRYGEAMYAARGVKHPKGAVVHVTGDRDVLIFSRVV